MSHYLPLHVHTDFSNGDALLGVNEYVEWAKENEYPSIAVTDHGNLCASLYFNQVATKAGIKSIIGLEAYCAFKHEFESDNKEEKKERDHFLLIAKNYQGYLDLCWLLGQAMRNSFYYKPIILYEELVKYNKNLIVSSACMGGRIPKLVTQGKEDEAIKFIKYMKSVYGDDFYIEIMEVQMAEQTAFNQWVINNYKRLGVKVLWTTDTHYLKPEHAEAHDVMKLINTKGSFKDDNWQKRVYKSRNLWLKKREDIIEEAVGLGYDIDIVNEFLDNTLEIDAKVEKVKLTRAPEVIMPSFSDNSYEILEKQIFEALKKKGWDKKPEYVDRVKTELEVIKFKKMEDYFLIVADIVNYAENNDVLCGCGRGCFLPGSKVECENKKISIEDIKVGQEVYSASKKLRKVNEVYSYDVVNEIIVKIKLKNGDTLGLGCTLDHKVFTDFNTQLKEADTLQVGEHLIKCLNEDTIEINDIVEKEKFLYTGKVYDLNVDEEHTYNINGYSVHNSGAGSLVVHLLGITKIDPIKYGLYFERFLNVKRLDPPDIDLDFDSKTRYKIEEHLKEKYGKHAVSHVISFGTFGIKGSIRDTFRVFFGTEKKDRIDRLSKCLENDDDDFDKALEKMIALEGNWAKIFIEENKQQFDIARILVGKNRHYSMHAGGVIIAPDSLEKYIPIMRIKDNIATGYPEGGSTRLMTDAGLMKFDILGLNACTIINDTFKHLKGVSLDSIIDNDSDPKILEQFTVGRTFSIFQFEGKNITKFIKRAKPMKFIDLVAVNALYRPAIIQAGGLETYLKNKENYDYEKSKQDPFERVLSDSYGLMIYQESSMRVFQELGGFTLAEADETRHVFKLLFKGNTDYTDFNHMMDKFREGCHKTTNYDDKKIEEIMDVMKNFSKYSFNRSHSCAYAMMAYIMMYLRTYHPNEYFSSLLSNTENTESAQDGKKVNLFQNYVTEIQKSFDINICKPDVNISASDTFRIKEDGSLIYALGHIKDVGMKAATNIQENQPYTSFKDFLSRVTRRVVNKRVIRALIYSEAIKFDDTIALFKKETGEEIDITKFLQKQFDYTGLVASQDLKDATGKEYSLKSVEKAAAQGKTLDKRNAIPIIVFVSKFRRLAGNAKKTGNPYVMYFATIYDGTTRIDDCILDDAESLNIEEGNLISGKLYFHEAKNKKYSDYVYYLVDIKKIKNTERYDALGKFNISTKVTETVKEEKPARHMISRKKTCQETCDIKNTEEVKLPKMISRKKRVVESEPVIDIIIEQIKSKLISRKQSK